MRKFLGDTRSISHWLIFFTVLFTLGGCASNPAQLSDPENDPWEPLNRKVYKMNSGLDKAIFRPVARAYDKVLPDPVQNGIGNFLHNLAYPMTIINLALQGKFKQSAIGTGRFLLNSTVGLLGFVDVATKADIPDYNEDLGQTLATWGYKNSRYVMLPFLGPATIRDGFGRLGNVYTNPVSYLAWRENIWAPYIIDLIDLRAGLLTQDEALEEALDPYLLVRDAWLQQREYKIYDGDPPLPDYEDYLDEDYPE